MQVYQDALDTYEEWKGYNDQPPIGSAGYPDNVEIMGSLQLTGMSRWAQHNVTVAKGGIVTLKSSVLPLIRLTLVRELRVPFFELRDAGFLSLVNTSLVVSYFTYQSPSFYCENSYIIVSNHTYAGVIVAIENSQYNAEDYLVSYTTDSKCTLLFHFAN